MSITEALAAAGQRDIITKSRIKDLPDSCCEESDLEVYDLDGYVRSLRMDQPAKSCDGVWAGLREEDERLMLIEMKSISNMRYEFHYSSTSYERGATAEETLERDPKRFRDFVASKLPEMELKGKFDQSNDLLERIEPGLSGLLRDGFVRETAILLCGLDLSEFIALRHIFNSAMREIESLQWGRPQAIPCAHLMNEDHLETLM